MQLSHISKMYVGVSVKAMSDIKVDEERRVKDIDTLYLLMPYKLFIVSK